MRDLRIFGSPNLRMNARAAFAGLVCCLALLAACSKKPDVGTAVMLIESSPSNLDPRIGTDAQSERIDKLIFDGLVARTDDNTKKPWIAKSWDVPDPLTD